MNEVKEEGSEGKNMTLPVGRVRKDGKEEHEGVVLCVCGVVSLCVCVGMVSVCVVCLPISDERKNGRKEGRRDGRKEGRGVKGRKEE
jgi:hypothetical protein